MKFGSLKPEQLKEDFTWGKGAEIKIVDDPGGKSFAKGWTDPSHNIEIDIRLIKLLENAKPEDREAALLAVVATLLHEQTHRGDNKAGRVSDSREPGASFINEIYSMIVSGFKFPDADFDGTAIYQEDFEKKILEGAHRVMGNKRERKEEDDLPKMTWEKFDAWLNNAQLVNPKIVVK